MRIGLIDVDGHNFPNLALMRISAWHKAQGDAVEWFLGDLFHYDIVYKSKVFSDDYTKDLPDPVNADRIIKAGTGYAISLQGSKEVYDAKRDKVLPAEVERMRPDYTIYPEYNYAVSMTSRGCPNCCGFCHVWKKEGCSSVQVANVSDFWTGQKTIKVLDANLTACDEKRDLLTQYQRTGARIEYTQGLDIRLLTPEDINILNNTRVANLHFAWDNAAQDLQPYFKQYAEKAARKIHNSYATVYCLTNYTKDTEAEVRKALYRINTLRKLEFNPFVMIYDKPHAPKVLKALARWVNNKIIFGSGVSFKEYLLYMDKYMDPEIYRYKAAIEL